MIHPIFQENRVHQEVVQKGKAAIDEWRISHPGEQLNLLGSALSEVDLSGADLSGANFRFSVFINVNLTGANLSGANLASTSHSNTILSKADLNGARLVMARLHYCNLNGANLAGADFNYADLTYANLSEANLFGTDLALCRLHCASLLEAELTGSRLYGTARDDWDIRGVKCRYVFWDRDGKERTPRDRDLEPGEFERLYAQLPTIEYVFENGMTPMDPLVMDRIVHAINERSPEFELQVDSINARGLQPTIRFTVSHAEYKAAALEAIVKERDVVIARLEGKYEALLDAYDRVIKGQPINIGSGSMVAIGGSSINVQEYIHHLEEIEQAVKEAPDDTLPEAVKREALETVNGAMKDVARSKFKEAAEAIVGLGGRLGPRIANSGGFDFFRGLAG